MRDLKELQYAFGRADADFTDNVYRTLANLQKKRNRRPAVRTGLRFAAAAAAVVILSAGTALALTNTWGILDFLAGRRQNVEVLPEASALVQKDVPQAGGQTDLASFSVREAVYDGKNFYIVVAAKPANPKYLLLGEDAAPSDPIGNLGPRFSEKTGTIADYARENKKEMINASVVYGGGTCSVDFLMEEDGTLVYMMNGGYTGGAGVSALQLTCATVPYVSRDGKDSLDMGLRIITPLSVTLKNAGSNKTAESTAPAVFSDCGVRVDKVTLTGSAMAVYAEISYTVVDKAKFDATDTGLCFEFLGADGNRLPDGAAGGGGTTTKDNVHFVQESSLGAMEKLPQELTVRGFNCWDKNKYETHVFEMK